MSDLPDRIRGVFLGLAAGDRIGGPIRMALTLAGSLLKYRAYISDAVFADYLDWWRTEGFDTGPVADAVFRLVDSGVPRGVAVRRIHESTGGMTAGCNPAHRIAPLAAARVRMDSIPDFFAETEAQLTHLHPLAGQVSRHVVTICTELIYGENWEYIDPDDEDPISAGGFAPEVLAAALHFVDRHQSFETALEASIAFAGAANYCPVLVGAIGGARWGASAIPPAMLAHCNILKRVRDVADAFVRG